MKKIAAILRNKDILNRILLNYGALINYHVSKKKTFIQSSFLKLPCHLPASA